MKKYVLTVFWAILVWFCATMFFVLFGERVLFTPGTDSFLISTFILLIGTAILLLILTYLYLLFDKSEDAALKFGLIGTILGLSLDMFSLSNHQIIFPQLNESQIISFTVWMSFAYALYLIIPTIIHQRKKKGRAIRI